MMASISPPRNAASNWLAPGLLALCCKSTNVTAQYYLQTTMIHTNHQLKGYAVKQYWNNSTRMSCASTSYYPGSSYSFIHYMKMNPLGQPFFSYEYQDGAGQPAQQARTVEIVGDPASTDKFIIASVRLGANTNPGPADCIRWLHVDGQGGVIGTKLLLSGFTAGSNTYGNAYPMGALWYNDQVYVCGYATSNGTALPNFPDWGPASSKVAFVLVLDASGNVVASHYYDWTFSPYPAGHNRDYDRATRMQILSNGNLWLTGSTNHVYNPGFGDRHSGGIMNLQVDPATLAPISDAGFRYTAGNEELIQEGVAMVEAPSGNYVVGNSIFATSLSGTYHPQEIRMNITAIDAGTYAPYPAGIFSQFERGDAENNWAQQATVSNGSTYEYLVAGADERAGPDDIRPFLLDITTGNNNGSIFIPGPPAQERWARIGSISGTGTVGLPNSYYTLPDPLSHPMWQPPFALLDNTLTTDYKMITPRWVGDQALAPKYAKGNMVTPVLPCGSDEITVGWGTYDVNQNGLTASTLLFSDGNAAFSEVQDEITAVSLLAEPDYCLNDPAAVPPYDPGEADDYPVPKPAGVGSPTASPGISALPNPASSFVRIALPKNDLANEPVEVSLYDLQGRSLGLLFKGGAAALNTTSLSLPGLAPGAYLLRIRQTLVTRSIKLMIQ